jgi:hypothetical protein
MLPSEVLLVQPGVRAVLFKERRESVFVKGLVFWSHDVHCFL